MIPENEGLLSDKMERASLNDLMPDFDKDTEWQKLSQKMLPAGKKVFMPVWSYAAAILVILFIGGAAWRLSKSDNVQDVVTAREVQDNKPSPVIVGMDIRDTEKAVLTDSILVSKPTIVAINKHTGQRKRNTTVAGFGANDVIYNGTPCPIEVRISQVMRCPNNQPRSISSSSTIEPDQSGKLNYKENNAVARNCSLSVKEIEIKSMATGEAILLNSTSLPSTAQEVFSYITREKKGEVLLAGMFNYDCDKKKRQHSLSLNNRDGNLILE